jgi:hypothetical protein
VKASHLRRDEENAKLDRDEIESKIEKETGQFSQQVSDIDAAAIGVEGKLRCDDVEHKESYLMLLADIAQLKAQLAAKEKQLKEFGVKKVNGSLTKFTTLNGKPNLITCFKGKNQGNH